MRFNEIININEADYIDLPTKANLSKIAREYNLDLQYDVRIGNGQIQIISDYGDLNDAQEKLLSDIKSGVFNHRYLMHIANLGNDDGYLIQFGAKEETKIKKSLYHMIRSPTADVEKIVAKIKAAGLNPKKSLGVELFTQHGESEAYMHRYDNGVFLTTTPADLEHGLGSHRNIVNTWVEVDVNKLNELGIKLYKDENWFHNGTAYAVYEIIPPAAIKKIFKSSGRDIK